MNALNEQIGENDSGGWDRFFDHFPYGALFGRANIWTTVSRCGVYNDGMCPTVVFLLLIE